MSGHTAHRGGRGSFGGAVAELGVGPGAEVAAAAEVEQHRRGHDRHHLTGPSGSTSLGGDESRIPARASCSAIVTPPCKTPRKAATQPRQAPEGF
jgi:hypothetical protein